MNARDWALLLVLSVLWGGSFFFARIALDELPAFAIVFARLALSAFAILAWLRLTGRPFPSGGALWGSFFVMGALNNLLPFSLIVWAQTTIASGLAAILNATTPLFSVLLAHALTTDEKATAGKLIGVFCGLAGVIVMIGPGALRSPVAPILPELACLAAAFSYALAGLYGRRFFRLGVDPAVAAFGQLAASSIMSLPLALLAGGPALAPVVSARSWAALVGLAILSTAIAYGIYFSLLARVGSTNLLLVTLLIPVSAILLGVLLLHESLSPDELAGMALIGLGLAAIDGRPWLRIRASLTAGSRTG
jgi:drug/metabolite transporter (DMT)-like permease